MREISTPGDSQKYDALDPVKADSFKIPFQHFIAIADKLLHRKIQAARLAAKLDIPSGALDMQQVSTVGTRKTRFYRGTATR